MKRSWLILTTLVVAIALISGLILVLAHSPGRNPETWENITESYIRQRGWVWERQVTIKQAVKAHAPHNFTQEMNFHTYSDALPYYAVDEAPSSNKSSRLIPYTASALITEALLSTPSYAPYTTSASSGFRTGRPIPYPPTEAWCVLLKLTAEDTYLVIFANLHQDMYNAQWIIHEGEKAPFSPAFLERVARFGCGLDMSALP